MTETSGKKSMPMDERIKQRIYGAVQQELAALGSYLYAEDRMKADVKTQCRVLETLASIKIRCESSCIETELMVQTTMASMAGLMARPRPGEQATPPAELANLIRRASRPGGQQQETKTPDAQQNDDKPGV